MIAKFQKKFAKQLRKHPYKVQATFRKRLDIFLNNPFNELLSNHTLSGNWTGYRSINISGDLRAVYRIIDQDTVLFVAFGTHSQLYG